jgi:hypothetical protein
VAREHWQLRQFLAIKKFNKALAARHNNLDKHKPASFFNLLIQRNVQRMRPPDKRNAENHKNLVIKVSAEIRHKLDRQKKRTGETLSKMVERAIANLLDADQKASRFHTEQELLAQQLHEIANDLRKIVHKIDAIAPEHTTEEKRCLNMLVLGKKQLLTHRKSPLLTSGR